jgi:hypothetical protein
VDQFLAHIDGRMKDIRVVRQVLVRGRENRVRFTNPNRWHAYGEARESAKFFAGLAWAASTIPFVSDRGPMIGRIVGTQTPDGTQGWRIDWSPDKDLHVNWWDYSEDPRRRDKSLLWYGANDVAAGDRDFYWQIIEHFPNPLSSRV